MVRQIENGLVVGLVELLLTNCAAGVKTIQTYKIEKKREPLAIADPVPLVLQDIDWIIITKDDADLASFAECPKLSTEDGHK